MKTIFSWVALMISLVAVSAVEKDVWYDANGKVVKVTPAEQEKKAYVPGWKRLEQERLARMEAQRLDRSSSSRSSRTNYWDPYNAYYQSSGYYYQPYYNHGWSCRPAYHHGRSHGHSSFRFNGGYRSSGWSVRVKF